MKKTVFSIIFFLANVVLLPVIWFLCIAARIKRKKTDIGIGPEPLINNVWHKKALIQKGFTAETFVDSVFFITQEFDLRADLKFPRIFFFLKWYYLFFYSIFSYKAVYMYFNGGPLRFLPLLKRIEPILYHTAGTRLVLMPYGIDVQDFTLSKNLYFKHAAFTDYPLLKFHNKTVKKQIARWTKYADHIISGCEWIDYMPYWDTLTLAHFSIDIPEIKPNPQVSCKKLKILHAPNHKKIKGTEHLVKAVETLQNQGYEIDLMMLEKVPNEKIKEAIIEADIVADQFVVGWYAMFALEAMAQAKPVMCFLRSDLIELYENAGLIETNEIPILNTSIRQIQDTLLWVLNNKEKFHEIGAKSRNYVIKHHSTEKMGEIFYEINKKIGLTD
jgi:glycosyltransferase involved in cell wall biosynthesis